MLRLNKITLTNFGRIDHAEIELDKNLFTLIIGRNGSGKSTVLQGIALCLSDYRRSGSYKEYIKHGTNYCESELLLEVHNEPMLIRTRIVPEKSSTGGGGKFIKYKGKEYKNSEAKRMLKQLIDINFIDKIIFSHQNSQNISDMSPSERRELLKKVISFNFVDPVSKLNSDIQDTRDNSIKIASKSEHIAGLEFKEHILENVKTEVQIKRLESSINSLAKRVKDLETQKIEYNYQANVENNKIKKDGLEQQIFENTNRLNNLISKANNVQLIISNKTSEQSGLKLSLQQVLDALENADSSKILKSEKEDEKAILANTKAHIKTLKNDLTFLHDGKCSVCKQSVENLADLISEKKSYISAFEVNIKSSAAKINVLTKNIEKVTVLEESIEPLNKRIAEVKTEIEAQEKLLNIDIFEATKSVTDNLSFLEKELKNLKDLEKAEFSGTKELKELKAKLEVQGIDLKTEQAKIEKNNLYEKLNKKILLDKRKNKKEVLKLKKEIKEIDSKIEDMLTAKNIIEITIPNFAIMKACTVLENSMNRFINEVKASFPVKLTSNKKGIDFLYSPLNNGIWAKVSNASGFESELISLAFQASLAKMFNIEILVLDEIDSAADMENSEKFYALLSNLKDFQQVIVITHKEKVIDILTGTDNCQVVKVVNGEIIL